MQILKVLLKAGENLAKIWQNLLSWLPGMDNRWETETQVTQLTRRHGRDNTALTPLA